MAIRPSAEKWTIYVKGLTGGRHSLIIERDATVRKMYREIRRMLKVTSAIKIAMGQTGQQKKDIPKSDNRIDTVGISNCCELFLVVQEEPDTFKVTISFPTAGSIGNKVINITEDKSTSELYKEVRKLIPTVHNRTTNTNEIPSIRLTFGDVLIEENSNPLRSEIFDGVELKAELVTITVLVTISKTYTVNISPSATLSQFYQKVRAVAPALNSNQQLRLILGQIELREDSTTLHSTGIHHGSTVFAVIRTVGGNDPHVQVLQTCPDKNIYGVTTPSTRACVHCGALVQHIEACKQMKCPACSKEFCFICPRKKDVGGYKCGNCQPAPRQTNIPSAT